MAPIVTAAASGSGQGSTAGSLELPIHLLEFSSSIPAKKEVSTAPRGTKVRPRPPAVAEKRDTIGGGGKMSGPASSSGRSSNREERNESLPAGVKEKHLQRESKRADNKPQSETEKEKEKEKRGEPLATFTGKQMTHEKTEAMHKATASGSRRMEKDGVSFDADVNEVVNSRDILSEKRATDGGGRRRKRRASQRDDSQIHRSGKPHVSAATKRPTWKRRAVLSSSSEEEEEEESCDEEPISSSDLEVQNSDSGERKGRASHHNEHQKSNLKRVREGARVRGQTTVRDCSVVITRYNRRVKPNRRYVSSDLYQHEEEDKEEESEEDEEEETDKDKENEDNEESEEEEEEDDIRIRESSEEKGQLPERENCTTGQEQPVAKRLRSRK